jgi:isopentenyl-diphosphate delta-isomerase
VNRRLTEEIGITCSTRFSHRFHYKIEFENGLVEHELDHVYLGTTDEKPVLNPKEVQSFKYMNLDTLKKDMNDNPANYTFWFHLIMKELVL